MWIQSITPRTTESLTCWTSATWRAGEGKTSRQTRLPPIFVTSFTSFSSFFFPGISKQDEVIWKWKWRHFLTQGVSFRLFTLLLPFFLNTKTTAPGLQVNWKKKKRLYWKKPFEHLKLSFYDIQYRERIKDERKLLSRCVSWPLLVIVSIQAQCWRSAALQTQTEFQQGDKIQNLLQFSLFWFVYFSNT